MKCLNITRRCICVCYVFIYYCFERYEFIKREYVCVKAWASAEDCMWEKETEYGKYASSVK